MTKKKTNKTASNIEREFDSFDLAWEYMVFLAKLVRSTGAEPIICSHGRTVKVSFGDHPSGAQKSFLEGEPAYFTHETDKHVVSSTTESGYALTYTDGGSRGNPGPSASGYVVYNQDSQELARGGDYLGVTTNNQAEYHSLIAALKKIRSLGFDKVEAFMDSQLVVNQIKGVYKVKNRDLYPLYDRCMQLLGEFGEWKLSHVPRELNKVADGVVNDILDDQAGKG